LTLNVLFCNIKSLKDKLVNMQVIETVLKTAQKRDASDVHITNGQKPRVRVDDRMQTLADTQPPTRANMRQFLKTHTTETLLQRLEDRGAIDVTADIDDRAFRLHAFSDHNGLNFAFRLQAKTVEHPDSLGVPQTFVNLLDHESGLMLIAGPTGAGKSTTRASLIGVVNETENKHILSLSDTVEFSFTNNQSLIRQREVGPGKDARSYPEALADALRQDPDIITLGDLRDQMSMELALDAAQTGHLVIAEIHAHKTTEALTRILSATENRKSQAGEILANQFRGALAQRLVSTQNSPGPTLATELLVSTEAVRSRIRSKRLNGLNHTMRSNGDLGMHTLQSQLEELVRNDQLSQKAAQELIKH
jgi:twitching motility protein PilT